MMRAAALLLVLTSATPVVGADPAYCTAWSRGAATMAIGVMPPAEQRAITYPRLAEVLNRFAGECGLLEEDAAYPDALWTAELVNELHASAPAAVASPPHVCGRDKASPYGLGTPEQVRWCRAQYRSYDARTGTVLCASHKRERCS